MSRLFLSRNTEDGNGRAGASATIGSSMHVLIDAAYWCSHTIVNRSACDHHTRACPFEWYRRDAVR